MLLGQPAKICAGCLKCTLCVNSLHEHTLKAYALVHDGKPSSKSRPFQFQNIADKRYFHKYEMKLLWLNNKFSKLKKVILLTMLLMLSQYCVRASRSVQHVVAKLHTWTGEMHYCITKVHRVNSLRPEQYGATWKTVSGHPRSTKKSFAHWSMFFWVYSPGLQIKYHRFKQWLGACSVPSHRTKPMMSKIGDISECHLGTVC